MTTKRKRQATADEESLPYHGECLCEATYKDGRECQNGAYYVGSTFRNKVKRDECVMTIQKFYLCGTHSRSATRTELPKNPHAKTLRDMEFAAHEVRVVQAAGQRKAAGKRGRVTGCKMRMLKPVPLSEGVRNVFPNYRHAKRTDGYGCPALSPMCLGPVEHNEPGVPPSKTIENYHKVSFRTIFQFICRLTIFFF